jgi:hypothetical protein
MFVPTCHYQNAMLIYWASAQWKADQDINAYIVRDVEYHVGTKKRRLVLIEASTYLIMQYA